MRVLVEGSGGTTGWPEPGCRCASCLRQTMDGNTRRKSTIVVDGQVRLGTADPGGTAGYQAGGTAGYQAGGTAGYQAGAIAGGWELTTPDGGRLLYPAGPGAVPVPPEDAAPYDVAFLDLLGDPAQLGWLRARGLITADTVTGGGVRRPPRAVGAGTRAALRLLAGEAGGGRRCGQPGPFGPKRS